MPIIHMQPLSRNGIHTAQAIQQHLIALCVRNGCQLLTEDGIRLGRALKREAKQNPPKYDEMCRRYLADCEDFSEERLKAAGITRRFSNDGILEDCISEVKRAICEAVSTARGSQEGCAGTERTGNEGT